ncbi:hypothetical protein SAMN07250955_10758 [Arboricoccus pini]|uniref:TRAP transporter solute receptor, TAXI family n=1 Tax=Arboricoccus pini TaxID=1963835 RepID=A0A212RCJ4_9PROT|nr:TAXI family TRAP transporter solute-binding subunit [Arboricoccus pini]SNB69821.1 hypothetical protein SAMN07250955_10758 [Arboricoccus pini]
MTSMAITRRPVLAGLGSLLAGTVAVGRGQAAALNFVRIGTARGGGSYAQLGKAMVAALSSPPGAACDTASSCGLPGAIVTAQPSAGSRANVKALVDSGIEFALCQADVATWLAKGEGPLRTGANVDSLRVVAALGDEAVHLLVRADAGIGAIGDLRGKRVALGEEGSGTRVDADFVLGAFGIQPADLQASNVLPLQALRGLLDGQLDAAFLTGAAPLREVNAKDAQGELAPFAGRIALLPLDGPELQPFLANGSLLTRTTLAEGLYGIVPPGGLATLSTRTLLVTMRQQQARWVSAFTAALWSSAVQQELQRAGFNLKGAAEAIRDLPLMLHDGALKQYRAMGLA